MGPLIFLLAFAIVVIGVTVLPPVVMLYRESPRNAWLTIAAASAFAIGAIPALRIILFRYMIAKDYTWAIRGPEPFSQLGSGPWWLGTILFGVIATGVLWGIGFWILVWAREEV